MPKLQHEADTFTTPKALKPLPGQLALPFDRSETARQAALFDDGRDLPGAGERDQRIIWDLPNDR